MSRERIREVIDTATLKRVSEDLPGSGPEENTGMSREVGPVPTRFVAETLFEHAPVPMLMVDHIGRIQHINRATEDLFGYPKEALIGELVEILVPSDVRSHHEHLRRSFMGNPVSRPMAEGRRLLARKRDGSEVAVDIALNPVIMETLEPAVVLSVIDNTSRERADRAEFFVKELTHRARNMFAIINAISRQVAKSCTSVADFQTALERRLNSLSKSYQVFEKENWGAALINDLVCSQLAFVSRQDMPQIDIAGPRLRLQSTPAEYLGLAIHELATNAVKHGALSVPTGAVDIRWSVDEGNGTFEFGWGERNGPSVVPSDRQGFGSAILKSIVPAACGGKADLIATPAGMSWKLKAPLARIVSHD
ncbi:MAG: sensor histidine kinase [Pseudorhizobium sp.]